MKKYIIGALIGYSVSEVRFLYHTGVFHRIGEMFKRTRAGEPELGFHEFWEEIAQAPFPHFSANGKTVSELRQERFEHNAAIWDLRRLLAQWMREEGMSNAKIAEIIDIPENSVRLMFEDN
jgi:hypothetical protein